MYKNVGRFFALSAIAALTIFAGKTFAESRRQPLFAETPIVKQEAPAVTMNVPSHNTAIEDDAPAVPAETPVAAPAEETVQAIQTSPADTNVDSNPADTTVPSNNTQHFSIKKGAGDDEDDDIEGDDDEGR
jgi:hypothetical protein